MRALRPLWVASALALLLAEPGSQRLPAARVCWHAAERPRKPPVCIGAQFARRDGALLWGRHRMKVPHTGHLPWHRDPLYRCTYRKGNAAAPCMYAVGQSARQHWVLRFSRLQKSIYPCPIAKVSGSILPSTSITHMSAVLYRTVPVNSLLHTHRQSCAII